MKNKKGNIAVIAIIIVIVAIAAGVFGWTLARNSQMPTQSTTTLNNNQNYIEVKELGFKIPVDLSMVNEITYKITNGSTAIFSSKTLNIASKYCEDDGAGAISKILGTPSKPANGDPEYYKARMDTIKQFDGFFLDFSGPQSVCVEGKADLQSNIVQIISNGFKNVSLIN